MKIGSFTPVKHRIENVRVFRPVQTLLFKVRVSEVDTVNTNDYLNFDLKVNVTLQNSKTGNLNTIIPYIELSKLADISTFNEGSTLIGSDYILYPVMLGVDSNVSVDNDKYLEINIVDIPANISAIEIYSYEVGKQSDFVARYSKMACPSGVARHKTAMGENDFLSLPISGFDELQITYLNGSVSSMSIVDLQYHMAQNNDITAVKQDTNGLSLSAKVDLKIQDGNVHDAPTLLNYLKTNTFKVNGYVSTFMAYANSFVMVLEDVESIEIIRDTDSTKPLEYILGDFVDTKKAVSVVKTDKK